MILLWDCSTHTGASLVDHVAYNNISNNKLMYLTQGAVWVASGMSCGDVQWNAPAILLCYTCKRV
jgi:hypothetical protein